MKEEKNTPQGQRRLDPVFAAIIVFFLLTFLLNLFNSQRTSTAELQISYNQFMDLVEAGAVEQVYMDDDQIQIRIKEEYTAEEVARLLGADELPEEQEGKRHPWQMQADSVVFYTGRADDPNLVASLASKLDAVVIVALITGCVSIVGVLISSIVAKRIEYKRSRQEYLAKKREEPSGQFVDMVYKIQQNTKKGDSYTEAQMLKDLSQFSKQITLWGSSRVVNKWVKFRENGTNPELAQKNLLLLEDIMNEMRKDLGLRKTKKGNCRCSF